MNRRLSILVALIAIFALAGSASAAPSGSGQLTKVISSALPPAQPNFGPNVVIIDPSMSTTQIQTIVDAISTQQIPNQFGTQRYAVLFKPGTYGSSAAPLNFQIGYYTDVAGLGALPTDVTINGTIDVYNQCFPITKPDGSPGTECTGLVNFWRSISNLTINVAGKPSCYYGEFWATSQATSLRRLNVNGYSTLTDYCSGPGFVSGGFIADSQFGSITVANQQQYLVRNGSVGGWSNAVWNQVFAGVTGAPAQSFPKPPYTTLATNPESREKPFLYVDSMNHYNVFVPDVQLNSSGTTWSGGQTAGHSIPIGDFFIAKPSDSVQAINNALAQGKNLILTPGIYDVGRTIEVKRPDTIVLGMGLATIVPQNGVIPMKVADVKGVEISDLIFDAGPVNSPVLLQVGTGHASNGQATEHNYWSDPSDPTTLSDVYFRIGGAGVGKATVSLEVNADNVILDNIWAWRADHGAGVGWTSNTADTGVIVNGDNVVATGLFVEHYQKNEVIWNGDNGKIIFFQNEMPYDPPSQAAWTQPDGTLGYPAVRVTNNVKTFQAWGMGSYSFFNQGVNIYSANAFVVPTTLAAGSLQDLLTIFLSTAGFGGILNVVNDIGGSSTIANPDTVVPVVSYP
jgi:hypothetical protein